MYGYQAREAKQANIFTVQKQNYKTWPTVKIGGIKKRPSSAISSITNYQAPTVKNYLRYSESALRKQTDRTKDSHAIFLITNYQAPTVKNYLRYSELALRKQTDRTKECHATFSITNYQAPTVKNYLRYSELALRKQTDRK